MKPKPRHWTVLLVRLLCLYESLIFLPFPLLQGIYHRLSLNYTLDIYAISFYLFVFLGILIFIQNIKFPPSVKSSQCALITGLTSALSGFHCSKYLIIAFAILPFESCNMLQCLSLAAIKHSFILDLYLYCLFPTYILNCRTKNSPIYLKTLPPSAEHSSVVEPVLLFSKHFGYF